jgi:hypothetical protein
MVRAWGVGTFSGKSGEGEALVGEQGGTAVLSTQDFVAWFSKIIALSTKHVLICFACCANSV